MKETVLLRLSLVISIPDNFNCHILLHHNDDTHHEVSDSAPPCPNSSGLLDNAVHSSTEVQLIQSTTGPACTKEDLTAANSNVQQWKPYCVNSVFTSPNGLKKIESINGCVNTDEAREVGDAPYPAYAKGCMESNKQHVYSEEQAQVKKRNIDNTVCSSLDVECIENDKENVCTEDEIAALEQLRQLKRKRIKAHGYISNSVDMYSEYSSVEAVTASFSSHGVSSSSNHSIFNGNQQQHSMADTMELDFRRDLDDETYIFSITSDFDERQHPKIRLLADVYDKAEKLHVTYQNSAGRHRKAIGKIMKIGLH